MLLNSFYSLVKMQDYYYYLSFYSFYLYCYNIFIIYKFKYGLIDINNKEYF